MPCAKLRASSKAPSPPASGSRNVHNQAINFSVLKRDPHALVLHVFKDLNCYPFFRLLENCLSMSIKLGLYQEQRLFNFSHSCSLYGQIAHKHSLDSHIKFTAISFPALFFKFKRIDDFPVLFHIHNRPSFCICLI